MRWISVTFDVFSCTVSVKASVALLQIPYLGIGKVISLPKAGDVVD